MFDLMAEVEALRSQKKNHTLMQPVQVVQVVQSPVTLKTSSAATLVQAGAKREEAQPNVSNLKTSTTFAPLLHHPNPTDDGGLHHPHHLHQGQPLDLSFLKGTPMTEAMIWEGFKRWKQPFCSFDLANIYIGTSKPDDVIRYLYWWMNHHKELYQQLRTWAKATEKKPLPTDSPDELQTLASRGLELLPEDGIYIKSHLARMVPRKRKEALTQYAEIWLKAMEREAVEHRKQNAGRTYANTYLRETAF
ncbi:MAG: hypothetical protein KUG82_19705 [Pseudomonadales bacterium]|nr:hypothetical protein [Pseudomonadales bacterium]